LDIKYSHWLNILNIIIYLINGIILFNVYSWLIYINKIRYIIVDLLFLAKARWNVKKIGNIYFIQYRLHFIIMITGFNM